MFRARIKHYLLLSFIFPKVNEMFGHTEEIFLKLECKMIVTWNTAPYQPGNDHSKELYKKQSHRKVASFVLFFRNYVSDFAEIIHVGVLPMNDRR